jgi:glycine/D-amino acid oxidase-like deaminating enzyme
MEPSFWFRAVPDEQRFPLLEKGLETDAVIIGGGIAGLSACYFLTHAGLKTALLEQGTLGSGDSGFTTAFATHFLDDGEATRRAWAASRAGIQLLKETIAKEAIDCDWQDVSSFGFTLTDPSSLQEHYQTLRPLDPSLEYVEKDAHRLLGFPALAAYRKPQGEGQFHIRKFLLGLAECATSQGAQIFEESPAIKIETDLVQTPQGSVKANWIIVATGPPLRSFFPKVTALLRGVITYVLQVDFGGAKPFPRSLCWDDSKPYHYFRWLNEEELILGGEDCALGEKPPHPPHVALEEWLREVAGGAKFDIIKKWQGTIFYSRDFLPYASTHKSYGEHTLFLTGFGGNGMTHGLLAGKIAVDIIQNKESPHRDLFSFKR